MAARLPVPGSDDNVWGDILNQYLAVSLATDGTLNSSVVGSAQIVDGSITTTDISATAGITKTQLATAVQTSLSSADSALQSVPAATSTITGGVRLTGDFGGTATAPTTPTAVHLTGTETISGAKTFSTKIVATGGVQLTATSAVGQVWTASDTAGNGSWTSSAALSRSVQQITVSATAGAAAATDYIYYWTGSSAFTLTMPTAVANTNRYTLKNSSSISQTVATTASQTIEGTTTISILSANSVDLISNGSNWMVI